jgi:hypothetical protein
MLAIWVGMHHRKRCQSGSVNGGQYQRGLCQRRASGNKMPRTMICPTKSLLISTWFQNKNDFNAIILHNSQIFTVFITKCHTCDHQVFFSKFVVSTVGDQQLKQPVEISMFIVLHLKQRMEISVFIILHKKPVEISMFTVLQLKQPVKISVFIVLQHRQVMLYGNWLQRKMGHCPWLLQWNPWICGIFNFNKHLSHKYSAQTQQSAIQQKENRCNQLTAMQKTRMIP